MIATACEIIKIAAQNAQRDIGYHLAKICDVSGDWHPGTLPMMDLEYAVKALRTLAAMIEARRDAMVRTDFKQVG